MVKGGGWAGTVHFLIYYKYQNFRVDLIYIKLF